MRKFIFTLFVLLLSIGAKAGYSGKCGDNLTWTFQESTGVLKISGTGLMSFSSESAPWSDYSSKILKVEIDDGIINIEYGAFLNCINLASVSLTNGIIKIGGYAFFGCVNLSEIELPQSIKKVDEFAFGNCSFRNLHVPASLTEIGDGAFAVACGLFHISVDENNPVYDDGGYCNGIFETATNTLVTGGINTIIPETISKIGNNAFLNCTDLTSIDLHDKITQIGKGAFANCEELEDITIPNSVVGIGNLAFYATPWYANQPDGLVYAGKVVYEYKGAIAEGAIVKLKEGTLGIADFAFANISSNFSVDMPNSIENIGESAFNHCTGLSSISLPENLREIREKVFSGCSSLKSVVIHDSITSIGNEAFRYCTGLGTVIIGNGVKTIGEYAFDGCFLKSMTIGTGVIKIGAWQTMPYKTIWLTETPPNGYVNLDGWLNYVPNRQYANIVDKKIYNNLKSLFEVDGVIYVPDNSGEAVCDVINCRYDSVITSVVIGDSVVYNGKAMAVKDINPYSFYFLDSLNEVRVNNKGRIYDYAFVTGNITDVIVGDSVKTIDNAVFNGCYYMKTITLGSNLIRLGNYALAGCEQLEEIKCNAVTPPTCGTDALFGINKSKCKLIVPQGCLEVYKAANQWKEFVNISEDKQNTDISSVKDKSLDVKTNGGTIIVAGADDGTMVEVYGISGKKLGEAKTTFNTVTINTEAQAGSVVIVKVGNKAIKIKI